MIIEINCVNNDMNSKAIYDKLPTRDIQFLKTILFIKQPRQINRFLDNRNETARTAGGFTGKFLVA